MQNLLSLTETPKSGHEKLSGKDIQLLDSEVSCHITSMLNLLKDVQEIEAIPVALPNEHETLAIKK